MFRQKKTRFKQIPNCPAYRLSKPPGGHWKIQVDPQASISHKQLLRYIDIAERHGLLKECFADPWMAITRVGHALRAEAYS